MMEKNLTTGFSENKLNPLFNAGLLSTMLQWQRIPALHSVINSTTAEYYSIAFICRVTL